MRRWHETVRWAAASGVMLLAVGCSLALNWDQDQLQCGASDDPNYAYACLPGYTCDEPYCVADHSRGVGDNCSDANQCHVGMVCPLTYTNYNCSQASDINCHSCNPQCDPSDAFTESACQAGQFCQLECATVASFNSSNLFQQCNPNDWIAGCAKTSSCTPNTSCTVPSSPALAQGVCVQIRGDATSFTCMPACTITFDQNQAGAFTDTCGSNAANLQACTPIGANHAAQFVCMPLGDTSQNGNIGSECNVLHPCRKSLACIPDTNTGTSSVGHCYPMCEKGTTTCSTIIAGSNCVQIPFISSSLFGTQPGTTVPDNSYVYYCKP